MKFGVVIFPGSNCDRDMIDALRNDMQQEVVELWHKDSSLPNFSKEYCQEDLAMAIICVVVQLLAKAQLCKP